MRKRGFAEELGLARMFLLAGQAQVVPIDLQVGTCTTFIGIAGGDIRDLRLSVYDGEGIEVATDSVSGEGGLVYVCPQESPGQAGGSTTPHYFVAQASHGAGAVVAGAFVADLREARGFASLFKGILPPEVPFRTVEQQLAKRQSPLRSRGFRPVAEPSFDTAAEGDALRVQARLEPHRCYVAIAGGDATLQDIDLLVLGPTGAEVARDFEEDPQPELEFCPDDQGSHTFVARAFSGAGAMGLAVMSGPVVAADAKSPSPQTPQAIGPPTTQSNSDSGHESGDPLDALRSLAANMAQRGYTAPTYLRGEDQVLPGEVRSHELLLEAGCSVVAGAAGRSEADLDLYLTNAQGQPVDRDTSIERVARVRACTDRAQVYRVAVKAYGQRSTYAITVFRAPTPIRNVQSLRLEEASAAFRARGYRGRTKALRSGTEGEEIERSVAIPRRTCLAFAVAGDVPVRDVDLFLHDSSGTLLVSATGPEPFATVSRCADQTELRLLLTARIYHGEGALAFSDLEAPHVL